MEYNEIPDLHGQMIAGAMKTVPEVSKIRA
jgi:hypothetical protein